MITIQEIRRTARNAIISIGILLIFASCGSDDITIVTNPEYITSDIDLFWEVFDGSETHFSSGEFNDLYINMGSDGLRDYASQKGLASSLQSTLRSNAYITYYRAVRDNTLDLSSTIERADLGFRELKKIHPATKFYRVYFIIGALTAGGRVSENGLLIAAEMFSKNEGTPIAALSEWHQNVIRNKNYLSSTVMHEFIHKQQSFRRENSKHASVLEQSILEGMADYISHYIMDGEPFVNEHLHAYGDPIEEELWLLFKAEMNSNSNNTEWLYTGKPTAHGHPADMGYYMGYKILEAYSDNFLNKDEAVSAMLSASDYGRIFSESRYADKFD